MKEIIIGNNVTYVDVVDVARNMAKVSFSDEYVERVNRCRAHVEKFSREGKAIYGLTTGLGDNWDKFISEPDREICQRNTILSHTCSVGEPIDEEAVRAMMFVMLTTFGCGKTGIRIETLNVIKEMLNAGVTPVVPAHGSVGYIALEAHIGEVIIGEGKATYKGETLSGAAALEKAGVKPTVLSSKEGLIIVSGTTSATALTCLALYDSITFAKTADISGSMSLEVLKGTLMAMDKRLMDARPHVDQGNTGTNIRNILADSEIVAKYKGYRVQDALSIRCMPQLHGATKKCIKDAIITVNTELNSAVDNPLIFEDENGVGEAVMGCNADASYVGLAADVLAIAVTDLAKMSERRTDRMVNSHVSELPAFLNSNPGLNNGLMIIQYTSAGLLGELRLKCHPASIENIVTCANQEDYVNMGYNAAFKAYECVKLAKYIFGIELICACQAQDFYTDVKPASATQAVHTEVRKVMPHIDTDANMHPYLEGVAQIVRDGAIINAVESTIGQLAF